MNLWTWVGQNVGVVADVFTALALGAFAWMQWLISRRDEQQHRDAESAARTVQSEVEDRHRASQAKAEMARQDADELQQTRSRNAKLAVWGGKVIDMMADLETACDPLEHSAREPHFDLIGARASALVDRGRLFFPNVASSEEHEGLRVELLDHVIRACYVARHMAVHGTDDARLMRHHIWQARRRFVTILQREMGPSLRDVTEENIGVSVQVDPRQWPKPTRPLKLPEKPKFA